MTSRNVDFYKKRRTATREEKPRILIVCEGEKTEPQYFLAFRPANIKVLGLGKNTYSLVLDTIDIVKRDPYGFDQVWCVFDRDDFIADNFNKALFLSEKKGYKVAYSNEAFELWYILHFDYLDAGISRDQYIDILKRNLGDYRKKDPDMYSKLKCHQTNAIRHASMLFQQYELHNPEKDKPSTTVHLLVLELNKWNK